MRANSGLTLIELILSIVIISIALSSALITFQLVSIYSADPMILQQSLAIGKSYIEEITAKKFPTGTCPGSNSGTRSTWDNVCDYNGLTDIGAKDQLGNSINSLAAYTVTVKIYQNSDANLNGLTGTGSQVVRIDVAIAHPSLPTSIKLATYKTAYGG